MSGNQQKETKIETDIENRNKLDSIEEAIKAIQDGEIIIVVDDEDRENEGDFIAAAELITPEIVNFMATHGRGLSWARSWNCRRGRFKWSCCWR